MPLTSARVGIVGVLVGAVLLAGCTHTVEHRVARITPRKGPTTRPAPQTALYKVKMRTRSEEDYHSVPGTAIILSRGETIGFQFDGEGTVYAVAGARTFPIDVPSDWRRLMWHTSFEEETQLAREMHEAADAALKAGVIVVGAAAAGWALGESLKRDRKKRRHWD